MFPRGVLLLLYAPSALLLAIFAAGLVLLGGQSFRTPDGWGVANYLAIFGRADYRAAFLTTIWLSLLTTLISIVIAYPVAQTIDRAGRARAWLIVLVIIPWLVSVVVRSYGWLVLLGNRGALNSLLHWSGVQQTPIQLLYNDIGVVIGLVHVFCPFMVISLLAVMQQLDRSTEEAAMSLGAGPIATFLRVTLPLTAPGMLSGSAIVFLLSIGAVLTPLLLGGPNQPFLAVRIYQDVFSLFNFPRASAMAFILMFAAVSVMLPLHWIERRLMRRMPAGDMP